MEIKEVKNKWQKTSPIREEIKTIYDYVIWSESNGFTLDTKTIKDSLEKIIAICEERGKY